MSVFIYALGGGFGHLTRAVSLARAIGGRARVRILTNSPYAGRVCDAMPELDLITVEPGQAFAFEGFDLDADCLVVDTFPRGLGGELVDVLARFRGVKVLVARDLNPRYVAAYDLSAFIGRTYDLMLDAEASPWLVRNSNEILSRDRARAVLGLHDSDSPCVLVSPAGNADELDWYCDVAAGITGCDVRLLSYWPAMELYAAADVVVGGAGYNTVYECLACGVPLVARPWPRKYDRQALRATQAARVVRGGAEAVAAAGELAAMRSSIGRVITFENGANESAEQLLHLTRGRDIQRL